MKILNVVCVFLSVVTLAAAADKPKLSLEDSFNSVGMHAEIAPDGSAVVITTERADWDHEIFRNDLWLYRVDGGSIVQLTNSGHDSEPKWSPDGRWIAFISERKATAAKNGGADDKADDKSETRQLYLISPNGGEAWAVTSGDEEVHTFAWSADSKKLYFATRTPWNKARNDEYKKAWKDVVQYRESERGDTIYVLEVTAVVATRESAPAKETADLDKETGATPGARELATSPFKVESLLVSPDGAKLAFNTNSINERQEKMENCEIYTISLQGNSAPHRVTNNMAQEGALRWASDSRHILFTVEVGDVAGPYRDLQPHLYWIDSESEAVEQWSKDFIGTATNYAVTSNGVLVAGRLGTQVEMYSASRAADAFRKLDGWDGTYEDISTAEHSPRIAFVYSELDRPAEVYLAESAAKLQAARPITSFNKLFTERALPKGKPYRWKADDGTSVEGMLIYPPGKFEAKNLPTFVFIHGGPADADGNHFESDWYQWAMLAASNGWLVFEPNYRGSTGYGDKFLMEIVPVIVSRPGKDILEGVDALVKDGIADADHLTVGGYSYGGYMTNWLITQTTRFKAAVTGAGAVENVGNWGNDDTTFDDAYFLGGRPWEAARRYQDEAAIYQIDKVRTPTHMVAGADDIRVAVLEDYLMEHALTSLGIPNKLLIFPGEGHGLGKNPWHGRIKVREELKWLQKNGGVGAGN